VAPALSWTPKREVYFRRSLFAGGVTFVLLLIAGIVASILLNVFIGWTLPVALILTLGFVIDDALRWRTHKFDRWQLAEGHLLHEDQNGTASIPLAEIDRVFVRLGNRVVVQMTSGQRIVLRYLPFPAQTAAQIRAALPPVIDGRPR